MRRYNPKEIEPKWQEVWRQTGIYKTDMSKTSNKFYIIPMLPYTSGDLHIGHWYNFGPTDTVARFHRMTGQNVLQAIGFDAFGLPAENAAIKNKTQPAKWTRANIENMTKQLGQIGASYDWSNSLATCDPSYYHWNQWLFVQLHKHGLAYRANSWVNWCPKDKTVLANEQVVGENNVCERCGTPVVQKEMEQWFFKITEYTERLLKDLDTVDWPAKVKTMQENWIGKSTGAEISFEVENNNNYVSLHGYEGSSKTSFHHWLAAQIKKRGKDIYTPDLPSSNQPDAKEQATYVLSKYKFDSDSVLLGHSYGSVTALRIVEQLNRPIKKLVLIAGFAEPGFLDGEKRKFEPTTDWNFDFEKIKKYAKNILILRAINDSAVPAQRADYLAEKLGGPIIDFMAEDDHACGNEEPVILEYATSDIKVFTTRPDTIFGATYMVLAPEHPMVDELAVGKHRAEVEAYVKRAARKTELERQEGEKDKTGVFTGSYAINPATKEKIPIWVADYVLMSYGQGAIMAVPAHDERDGDFAKKYNLPVKEVIAPEYIDSQAAPKPDQEFVFRHAVQVIVKHPSDDKYLILKKLTWKNQPYSYVTGGIEKNETSEGAAARELKEETGYKNIKSIQSVGQPFFARFYHEHKKVNRLVKMETVAVKLENLEKTNVSAEEKDIHEEKWVSAADLLDNIQGEGAKQAFRIYQGQSQAPYTGEGVLINSGKYDDLSSSEAREKIIADLATDNTAKEKTNYRLRDWLISRQRYWGTPIPAVYCAKCGLQVLSEKDLPVILPEDVEFTPTGRNPLLDRPDFVDTKCPNCGGPAKRETDTMDTFVDSSWYFLRYLDNQNNKAIFANEIVNKWAPVDHYIGGIEHAILHLLYARFIVKFLHDNYGLAFEEPFKKLTNQGIILGPDGHKMSKSRGNVVNPDEQVTSYGADSLRLYMMFMGPYEEGGPYNLGGIAGTRRFLDRLWTLIFEFLEASGEPSGHNSELDVQIKRTVHKAIKKVSKDLEVLSFNTAIAAMMEAVNDLYKLKTDKNFELSRDAWHQNLSSLVQLLAPFAPHIAEELWQELGYKESIHLSQWPVWDEELVKDKMITIAVQINGKVRAEIEVEADISEEDAIAAAQQDEKIAAQIAGKNIKKAIYVPGRLVSLVI